MVLIVQFSNNWKLDLKKNYFTQLESFVGAILYQNYRMTQKSCCKKKFKNFIVSNTLSYITYQKKIIMLYNSIAYL